MYIFKIKFKNKQKQKTKTNQICSISNVEWSYIKWLQLVLPNHYKQVNINNIKITGALWVISDNSCLCMWKFYGKVALKTFLTDIFRKVFITEMFSTC